MDSLVLATTSPHRIKAFDSLGIYFYYDGSDVEEHGIERPSEPRDLVSFLSKLKADAVSVKFPNDIVMGFDTVGCYGGEILEKPKSYQEAFGRLKKLSGGYFDIHTGLHLIVPNADKSYSEVVETEVQMREISDSEIKKYLDQGEEFRSHAIGFDPLNHYSSTFVEYIEGSYHNLMRSMPLETVVQMLDDVGFEI